jgi:uncharacterized protein (DUF2147 family)
MLDTTRSFIAMTVTMIGLGVAASSALAQSDQVIGLWLDDEGKAGIQIERCERSLCGRVVWLKEPNDTAGKPWKDILNPEASKRDTPVCGLQIMGDLKRETNGGWVGGWVYDPEEGKRYDLELSVKDKDTLQVLAFEGERVRSQLMDWKRLPDGTPRCK